MKTAAWCVTIILAVSMIVDFASDIVLKTGKDDSNWDGNFTAFLIVWAIVMFRVFFSGKND